MLGRPYQRGKGGVPAKFLADADLAGPLVFCLVLGFVLLLKGKARAAAAAATAAQTAKQPQCCTRQATAALQPPAGPAALMPPC